MIAEGLKIRVVRKCLIGNWLSKNTSIRGEWDSDRLVNTIQIYLRDDREEELADYLCDVVTLGPGKADRRRAKVQRGRGYVVLIVWTVLMALARLALVIGIFTASQTKFETIVFAMLVLTFAEVDGASRAERYYNTFIGMKTQYLLRRIVLKLKFHELEWERKGRIEDERNSNKTLARGAILLIIGDISIGLAWLIAVVMLVMAVLS